MGKKSIKFFSSQKKGENQKQKEIFFSARGLKNLIGKGLLNSNNAIFFPRSSDVGVLLLHGYTSTPYEFYDLSRYLADKGVSVYAPTIAGHGTSPNDLANTSIEEWKNSVEDGYAFLKKKVEKVFVVGSSLGGNLAFHLANKFNKPLSGVVSLGTPIHVRGQKLFKLFLYTYGWFKKNQKKHRINYRLANVNKNQVVYTVMPTKSLRRFFNFISKITIPSLANIKAPTLIIQSISDRIVNPESANYLKKHLGSDNKEILWVDGKNHSLALDDNRGLIFKAIYQFVSTN